MFKLYYGAGTCARASFIALEDAGAKYTTERLDMRNNQQNSPEYLKINPKGRVPALVTYPGDQAPTPVGPAPVTSRLRRNRKAPVALPVEESIEESVVEAGLVDVVEEPMAEVVALPALAGPVFVGEQVKPGSVADDAGRDLVLHKS